MNTKELESFLQIYQHKSIVKAARELFITPQGLGKILKKLEDELGVPLFERTQIGMEATKYGEAFRERAENILVQLENATSDFEKLRHSERSSVRLVLSFGLLNYFSPQMIFNFQQGHPTIDLQYTEASEEQAEQMLLHDSADLGLLLDNLDTEKFDCIPLRIMDLFAVVNRKNLLSKKERLSFADLKNQKLITRTRSFYIRTVIEKCCAEFGFIPNIIFETSGSSYCNTLCKENKGISILDEAALPEVIDDELRVIPLSDPSAKANLMIAFPKSKERSWAADHLSDSIVRWNGQHAK